MRQIYRQQVANDFKGWLYVLLGQSHVRFGLKADMCTAPSHVR